MHVNGLTLDPSVASEAEKDKKEACRVIFTFLFLVPTDSDWAQESHLETVATSVNRSVHFLYSSFNFRFFSSIIYIDKSNYIMS